MTEVYVIYVTYDDTAGEFVGELVTGCTEDQFLKAFREQIKPWYEGYRGVSDVSFLRREVHTGLDQLFGTLARKRQ